MTDYWVERNERLAALRTRASRLRLTIKSSRGDYYQLRAGTTAEFFPIGCCGVHALEAWIADLEGEVGGLRVRRPTLARMQAARTAVEERRHRDWQTHYEATRSKGCDYCGGPEDEDGAYRVGGEDEYRWVHRRCFEPTRKQRQRKPASSIG